MYSAEVAPFPVVIWTDSYGTRRHHFPESMGKVVARHQDTAGAAFYISKINAQPGRMLDTRFMDEFEANFFGSRKGRKQMNVILLGGNDIQTHAYNGAARLVSNIQTLAKWHDNSNCPLMICGIPPRPEVHYQIEDLANYVDSKMKNTITQRHTGGNMDCMFEFVKTFDFFRDKDGFCMTVNLYEEDGIHLNKAGTHLLCEKLHERIYNQAWKCFRLF
jgi:hypothetical protein